jgi:hypothetical protein
MTAKFCVNCGVGLGPADKFCAVCGTKVVVNCPTCGQVWDGVVVSETVKTTPRPAQVEVTPPPQVEVTPPSEITITESVSGNKPIYGPDFDKSKDCANCGKAGNKKACDACGLGSNQ